MEDDADGDLDVFYASGDDDDEGAAESDSPLTADCANHTPPSIAPVDANAAGAATAAAESADPALFLFGGDGSRLQQEALMGGKGE